MRCHSSMYLFYDPTEGGRGVLYDREQRVERFFSTERAQEVLVSLVTFLHNNRCDFSELDGFGVLVGRGSFTATRVATTIANTLALAYNVPVHTWGSIPSFAEIELILSSSRGNASHARYISAVYSAEPRIHRKLV